MIDSWKGVRLIGSVAKERTDCRSDRSHTIGSPPPGPGSGLGSGLELGSGLDRLAATGRRHSLLRAFGGAARVVDLRGK